MGCTPSKVGPEAASGMEQQSGKHSRLQQEADNVNDVQAFEDEEKEASISDSAPNDEAKDTVTSSIESQQPSNRVTNVASTPSRSSNIRSKVVIGSDLTAPAKQPPSLVVSPSISPRQQSSQIFNPNSVPRRSILKGGSAIASPSPRKDWDAIRAKKGMTNPSSSRFVDRTKSASHLALSAVGKAVADNDAPHDTVLAFASPSSQSSKVGSNLAQSSSSPASEGSSTPDRGTEESSVNPMLKLHNEAMKDTDPTGRIRQLVHVRAHSQSLSISASHSKSASHGHARFSSVDKVTTEVEAPNREGAADVEHERTLSLDNTSGGDGVVKRKKKKRRTSHKGLMSRLALQFPLIRRSFVSILKAYQQFVISRPRDVSEASQTTPTTDVASSTSGSTSYLAKLGFIEACHMRSVLEHLTNHCRVFTQQEIDDLFALAHLQSQDNEKLSFREFLIVLAMGYYLSDGPKPSVTDDPNFESIAHGFRLIKQAFHEMDDDGSGQLDRDELKQALFAASSISAKNSLLEDRFAELDFNSDNSVELKEFIYGVIGWVNLTTDEEIDEMEMQA